MEGRKGGRKEGREGRKGREEGKGRKGKEGRKGRKEGITTPKPNRNLCLCFGQKERIVSAEMIIPVRSNWETGSKDLESKEIIQSRPSRIRTQIGRRGRDILP